MRAWRWLGVVVALAVAAGAARAEELSVEMHAVSAKGVGKALGTVRLVEDDAGLALVVALDGIPPGPHRLHVHANPDCGPGDDGGEPRAGFAAGARYNPGTRGIGVDAGELPTLYVGIDEDGARPLRQTVFAHGLSLADLRGRSLILYANADNYRDQGGGNRRIACAVIPA